MKRDPAVSLQRQYYRETAQRYDDLHLEADPEHDVALAFLGGMIDHLSVRSILDLGSGTGRVVTRLKGRFPNLHVTGVEPVDELRQVGHNKGIPRNTLVDGDATNLSYADNSFDLVTAFGLLHHVRDSEQVVAEMLRVGRMGIFISDSNNFGQGRGLVRRIKQLINALGLWPLANWIKTRGRGYSMTEGDGVSFSYSVFKDYQQVAAVCRRIYLLDTRGSAVNIYRDASHVALLALKE